MSLPDAQVAALAELVMRVLLDCDDCWDESPDGTLVIQTVAGHRVASALSERLVRVGSKHPPTEHCHAFGGMTECEHEYIPFYTITIETDLTRL